MDNFSVFIETPDPFGLWKPPEEKPIPLTSDGPIYLFSRERFIKHLAKYKIEDNYPRTDYNFYVKWGTGVGSAKVSLDSNFHVRIDRLVDDLLGKRVWITKNYFKINTDEFFGDENYVANETSQYVKNIFYNDKLDSAKKDFNIDSLAVQATTYARQLNGFFKFNSINTHEPDRRTIYFDVIGDGQGQVVRQQDPGSTPYGVLEMDFDKNIGLIRCLFTTIARSVRDASWQTQVPYSEFLFAPTQNMKTIAKILITSIIFQ